MRWKLLLLLLLGFLVRPRYFEAQETPKATVVGKVLIGSVPLPRAKVELITDAGVKLPDTTITAPDGTYSFAGVPYGNLKLGIIPEGNSGPIFFALTVNSPYVNVSPIATPSTPISTPPPNVAPSTELRWAAFGYEDSPGVWSERFFKLEGGRVDEPKEGDVAIATGDVFARRDYLHFDGPSNSWTAFPTAVGVVRKGQRVTVRTVAFPKNPADTSLSKFVWIGF